MAYDKSTKRQAGWVTHQEAKESAGYALRAQDKAAIAEGLAEADGD